MRESNSKQGYLILEVLFAATLLAVLVVSLMPNINLLVRRSRRSQYETDARVLMQEGMEAGYNYLQATSDWMNLNQSEYHPAVDASGKWDLIGGVDNNLQARFNRKIEFEKVCRDNNGNQCNCASCSLDEGSIKLKTTVFWQENGALQVVKAEMLVVKFSNI